MEEATILESFLSLDPTNYYQHKNNIHDFDLILFRGCDIISNTIATIQGNNGFTHVGIIISPKLLPNYSLDSNKLYILESTFSYKIEGMNNGPPDVLTNQQFFGVQLRDLEDVLKSYIINNETKVYYRNSNIIFTGDFEQIFKSYHKKPFTTNNIIDYRQITPTYLELVKSLITKDFIEDWMSNSFTCVNLVLSIYKDVGKIDKEVKIFYPCELLPYL